jgi:hypothetical protein
MKFGEDRDLESGLTRLVALECENRKNKRNEIHHFRLYTDAEIGIPTTNSYKNLIEANLIEST